MQTNFERKVNRTELLNEWETCAECKLLNVTQCHLPGDFHNVSEVQTHRFSQICVSTSIFL